MAPATAAKAGPVELVRDDPPALPGPDWVRLRPRLAGICGSDLATVHGHAGPYFESIVSFPFTLGHEIVADVDAEVGARRVVVIPVLHCAIRGIDPVCAACATGDINRCERVAFGHVKPGLQTGFCSETGGGWSEGLVAHPLQLVDVPDDLSDEDAVMIEPTACAVRAARMHDRRRRGDHRRRHRRPADAGGDRRCATGRARAPIIAAKYPAQQPLRPRASARTVCEPGELARLVRSRSASLVAGDQLTGGVSQVFDCVGSSASIEQALQIVAPGGEVVLVGMPADGRGRPHRHVAPRGPPHRLLRLPARGLRRGHRTRPPLPARPAWSAPPTDSTTTTRPSPTPSTAGPRDAIKVAFDMRNS